jgi:hypothetical protein
LNALRCDLQKSRRGLTHNPSWVVLSPSSRWPVRSIPVPPRPLKQRCVSCTRYRGSRWWNADWIQYTGTQSGSIYTGRSRHGREYAGGRTQWIQYTGHSRQDRGIGCYPSSFICSLVGGLCALFFFAPLSVQFFFFFVRCSFIPSLFLLVYSLLFSSVLFFSFRAHKLLSVPRANLKTDASWFVLFSLLFCSVLLGDFFAPTTNLKTRRALVSLDAQHYYDSVPALEHTHTHKPIAHSSVRMACKTSDWHPPVSPPSMIQHRNTQ